MGVSGSSYIVRISSELAEDSEESPEVSMSDKDGLSGSPARLREVVGWFLRGSWGTLDNGSHSFTLDLDGDMIIFLLFFDFSTFCGVFDFLFFMFLLFYCNV